MLCEQLCSVLWILLCWLFCLFFCLSWTVSVLACKRLSWPVNFLTHTHPFFNQPSYLGLVQVRRDPQWRTWISHCFGNSTVMYRRPRKLATMFMSSVHQIFALTIFQNSFAGTFSSKFATKWSLKIPPHLKILHCTTMWNINVQKSARAKRWTLAAQTKVYTLKRTWLQQMSC